AWLNDDGTHEPLDIAYSGYGTIRVSPDGRRMALDAGDVGRLDIWYYDFERKTLPRLTTDPNADFAPIWLGNSETIIFESIRDGAWALYRQKISERDAELIMTFPEEQPFPNWASPDGRELLLTLIRGEISDIYKLTIEPEPALQPVLNT